MSIPTEIEVAADAQRDLDRAVAEQVFGIKKIFRPRDLKTRDDYWSPDEYHYILSGKPPQTHMIDAKVVPYFATDMTAVMEVVKKMTRDGWAVTMSNDNESSEHDWSVKFTRSEPCILYAGNGDDNSLPAAICEAALDAIADWNTESHSNDDE